MSRVGSGMIGVPPGSGAFTHGLLQGLNSDDHSQYLLLAGRSPKQTVSGKVHIFPAIDGVEPSLADDTRPVFLLRNNVSTELAIGFSGSAPKYPVWLQIMQDPGTAQAAWPLCLQPLGGVVGIWTLDPDTVVPLNIKKNQNDHLSIKIENLDNVGTHPQARLWAKSDVADCIFGVSGSQSVDFGTGNGGCAFFYATGNYPMLFYTNAQLRLDIRGNGDAIYRGHFKTEASSNNNALGIWNSSVDFGWTFYPLTNGSHTDVIMYEYGASSGDRVKFIAGGGLDLLVGDLKIAGKKFVFGANDSGGAGYRTVRIENA